MDSLYLQFMQEAAVWALHVYRFLADLKPSDWVIAACTLISPVVAVQVQKLIERKREGKKRKEALFEVLVATRSQLISFEHIRALNMIDLVFAEHRKVTNAWHDYFDLLNEQDEEKFLATFGQRTELFFRLLREMATALRYRHIDELIARSQYSPKAHAQRDDLEIRLRLAMLESFNGKPLKMDVTSLPVSPEALAAQIALQKKMAASISDSGGLKVTSARGRTVTYRKGWK